MRKFFKNKFVISFFTIYILITIIIFGEALTPASASSAQSKYVLNIFADIYSAFGGNGEKVKQDGKQDIEATSLKINGLKSEEYKVGEHTYVSYTSLPTGTKTVEKSLWVSSDSNVAKITVSNQYTKIDFLSVGTALITVKNYEKQDVIGSFEIKVGNKVYTPNLTVNKFDENEKFYFSSDNKSVCAYPLDVKTDLSISNLTFSYSDNNGDFTNKSDIIAPLCFTNKIYLRTRGVGNVILKVIGKYLNINGEQEISCLFPCLVEEKILADNNTFEILPFSDIVYTSEKYTIKTSVGENANLDKSQKIVEWNTSNASIASIENKGDGNCILNAKKAGNIEVYACFLNNYGKYILKTINIEIKQGKPINAKITSTYNFIAPNCQLDLKIIADDTFLNNEDFIWSISDNKFAEIDEQGTLYGNKIGNFTVTAVSKTIEDFSLSLDMKCKFSFASLIRKSIGHLSLFLLLALFASVVYYNVTETFLSNTKRKNLITVIIILCVGFVTAGISEILQLPIFTTGRSCTIIDVFIDLFGYVIGFLIDLFIFRIYKSKQSKNNYTITCDN